MIFFGFFTHTLTLYFSFNILINHLVLFIFAIVQKFAGDIGDLAQPPDWQAEMITIRPCHSLTIDFFSLSTHQ